MAGAKRNFMMAAIGGRALSAALMATTACAALLPAAAFGQQAAVHSVAQANFSIPAGPLSRALAAFGSQSGTQISYDAALAAGKTSPGFSGTASRRQALARILEGSGLGFSFSDERSAVITSRIASAAGEFPEGETALETIVISSGGSDIFGTGYTHDTPYQTAASVHFRTEEEIQRFRGSSASDMFKGVPGVLSGEARNSGAVDVNIRGMQGQGRVPVVVDGASQETTIYHGYNGSTARSYIDPDFIGSMSIEKGPSSGADATGATGGVVRMSTINPEDILLPGRNVGVRLKGGFNTNSTSVPAPATLGGYQGGQNFAAGGMDRSGLLEPTGGSGSAVFAARTDNLDFVAGYVRRKNGNHYAGENGSDGARAARVPNQFGNLTWQNIGLSHYRAGEEVLNTSQDITSYLVKGRLKLDNGHSLELGYSKYKSEYGHVLATQASVRGYQGNLSSIELDTYTARYRWKPDDSDLIDLKVDSFLSKVDNRINSAQYLSSDYNGYKAGDLYPFYFWVGSERYGFTASNTSRFSSEWGDLSHTYGGGFTREKVGLPDGVDEAWYTAEYGYPRDGYRKEWNAFTALEYKPLDWLTFNGSLRYQNFNTVDNAATLAEPFKRKADGWSSIASVTVEPLAGVQIYGKYGSVIRLPSIFESLTSLSFYYPVDQNPIDPERANNYEIGINYLKDNVLLAGDKLRLHAAWFNNHIDGYITRAEVLQGYRANGRPIYMLGRVNLDYAKMRGFEISGEYDTGKYFGGISWNHYTKTMFCLPAGITNEALYGRCAAGGTYNSFALQQVPPKDMVTVNLGARFLDDRLTVGGRFTYVGKRMVEGMGNGLDPVYSVNRINASKWKPYGIVDIFGSYKINDHAQLDLAVDNLTDRYYMDALNVTLLPAPGRTIRGSLSVKF